MAAGVHSPETLQALLRRPRTADLVLVLQALQNQPQHQWNHITIHSNGVATGHIQGFTDGSSTMNAAPMLSISDQEETSGGVEIPGRSTSVVHKGAGKYDEDLR